MLNKLFFPLTIAFILITGIFLRLYKIDLIPPHLSNDEISIAHDAFNINRSQKDEYGNKFPLSFKSQDTYKAPGYAYLLSPLFSFLPNTELTARIPSIIMGFITIIAVSSIAFFLSGNKKISLTTAAILSVTPWHIYTSRNVFEANIALGFYALGLLFFLINVYHKKINLYYLLLSSIFFVLSIYSYHSEWLYTPLTIIFLSCYFIRKKPKTILFYLTVCLLLTLPLIFDSIKNIDTTARVNTQVIWKEAQIAEEINNSNFILKKIIIVNKSIVNNYFSQINPSFLFFKGLGLFEKDAPLEMGLFLFPLIVPFYFGLIDSNKKLKKTQRTILYFLLITSPIVPALTHGTNILRNLIFIIPMTIIISLGFIRIFKLNILKKIIFFSILILSIFYFYGMYFYQSPKERADTYQNYRPIADYLKITNYKHAHIDNRFGPESIFIGVPHSYIGFYNEINPSIFQNRINDENGSHYGDFSIQNIDWNSINIIKDNLYVAPISNKPTIKVKGKIKLEKEIFNPNGDLSFEIWRGI